MKHFLNLKIVYKIILHWEMLLCRFGEGRKCLHNTTKKLPFLVSWEKALGHKKARHRSKKLIAAFLFIFSLLVHLVSCKTCYTIPSYVISEAQNDNGSISNCLPLRFKFKKTHCCQNCFSSNRRNNFFFFIFCPLIQLCRKISKYPIHV